MNTGKRTVEKYFLHKINIQGEQHPQEAVINDFWLE